MDATRHARHVQALGRAILETPGATTHEQRVASAAGRRSGDVTEEYLAKVRSASYRIVDDDLDRLKRGGLSEDAIFELTLAAAYGEAARRLDEAVAALRKHHEAVTARGVAGVDGRAELRRWKCGAGFAEPVVVAAALLPASA